MELDEVANRLYALPPEEFTAQRDAAARAADGAELRKSVKALRRPTAAAHEVNRLVRERTADVDALLDLGAAMRRAMGGDPQQVRRLADDRRSLMAGLVDPDLPTGVQQDVAATLEAATADPALGAAVRSGRLVKPLRYAGFGALPDVSDAVGGPVPVARTTRARSGRPAAPKPHAERKAAAKAPAAPEPDTERPAGATGRTTGRERSPDAEADLAAARQRCLELAGAADDAQRRYEDAVRAAGQARELLDRAEAERADAHRAARAAHREAERARREVGRLERR